MAIHTFGTLATPAHFVEAPDPANPLAAPGRPAAGTHLLVQNFATSAALPDIVTTAYGYWLYTIEDIPIIRVSGDNGTTWAGPFHSVEAVTAAVNAGINASLALDTANAAMSAVNTLSAQVAAGGTGTAPAVTSLDWTAIANRPDMTLYMLASARGQADGVAPLTKGLVPIGNLPLGTAQTQVAPGSHTHSFTVAALPGRTGVRSIIAVEEISAGAYPTLTTAEQAPNVKRVFYGSIRATAAQGLQPLDDWVNTQ
jgi:hypothetical protein